MKLKLEEKEYELNSLLPKKLNIDIEEQPDDVTCGPTCLHAIYTYWKIEDKLEDLVAEVEQFETGGTLAVMLGIHALKKGLNCTIYSWNLKMFDPVWEHLTSPELMAKLEKQKRYDRALKFTKASQAYLEFLRLGGKIRLNDLTQELIHYYLQKHTPIIAGLSSTYLYKSKREFTTSNNKIIYDDVRGEPAGHFVVIKGIVDNHFIIGDPYGKNPFSAKREYRVPIQRCINAIMLGVITYDANVLVITPTESKIAVS